MLGRIWGQTRNLDDRTLDPADLTRRRSAGRGRLRHPDMGTDTAPGMGTDTMPESQFYQQVPG